MNNYSLIEAFIGGHYPTEVAPDSPAAHLFRNGNDRDKALVYTLDKQLKYRRKEAESIRRTTNANTNLLLNELENGNKELESLRTGINSLEATNYEGFKAVYDSMEVTNNLLDDISWRLGQAVSKLGDIDYRLVQILGVLQESRSNEARQLVNQGTRLMLYGDYKGAEERFKLAYNYDVTDYQVLMNLGHVEIQKQDAEKAKDWYKQASILPTRISGYARSFPIWNIARIHYAKKEFGVAYNQAKKAANTHDKDLDENIFKVAIYAGLAGYKSECLNGIERAIHMNPKFFRAAIAHPDLHHIRSDVYGLLGKLIKVYDEKIKNKIHELESHINLLKKSNIVDSPLTQSAQYAIVRLQARGQSIISGEDFTTKWSFCNSQINYDLVSDKMNEIITNNQTRNSLFDTNLEKTNYLESNEKNTAQIQEKINKIKNFPKTFNTITIVILSILGLGLCTLLFANSEILGGTYIFILFAFLVPFTADCITKLFENRLKNVGLIFLLIFVFFTFSLPFLIIAYIMKNILDRRKNILEKDLKTYNNISNNAESIKAQGLEIEEVIKKISLEIAEELRYPKA